MSTVRRSARLAAKATNQPAAAPATAPAVVVSQPATVPAVAVAPNQPCSCHPSKKETVVRTIQNYLQSIVLSRDIFKILLVIEMFEFLDRHFDFINSEEFHNSKRFVITVHNKTLELEQELVQQLEVRGGSNSNDYNVYNKAIKLLQRIHTKCHLYGMDKFVTSDPVYKKFLDTYMEKFL
jgi:hypothetical protein